LRVRLLAAAAFWQVQAGDRQLGSRLAAEAWDRYPGLERLADRDLVLYRLSNALVYLGDWARLEPLTEEWLRLLQALGEPRRLTHARHLLAFCAMARGDLVRASALWDEEMAVCRSWNLASRVVICLYFTGHIALAERRFADAESLLRQA